MVNLLSILEEGNLFEEITSINTFPFLAGKEEELNSLLKVNYGLKTVHRPYESMSLTHIAQTLVLNYSHKWDLYYLQQTEILDTPFNEIEDEENSTSEELKSGSINQVNKVSAFNDSSLVDDDGSESNSTDDSESTRNKTYKRLDKNKKAAYDMLKESEKVTIIEKVLTDIVKSLTLDIY